MTFELTREQQEIQEKVRAFAQKELQPGVLERDAAGEFPLELFRKFVGEGMMGLPYPVKYGGQGGSFLSYMLAVEELAKVDASFSVAYAVITSLYGGSLMNCSASEEQKKRFLEPVLSGRAIGSFGLTERTAGSDVAGMRTTATRDGDDYIITGHKILHTNGPYADYSVIYCLLDPEVGTKSMAAFVLEKGMPGFRVGEVEDKMGLRSLQVSRMYMDHVRVSADRMIAQPGEGFKVAMRTLDAGRVGIAAQALGLAEGAFEIARAYMKEREQFGKPLYKMQYLAYKMAELKTEIEKARLMMYYAADCVEKGKPCSVPAAMAKMTCTDTVMHVTTECIQVMGANGYMKPYHVERMMRDAKISQIYEGSNEIQRLIISNDLFA